MIELLAPGLAGGGGLIAAVVATRAVNCDKWRRDLVAYSLRFPRGLAPEDVTAFVASLSGLTTAWWRRPFVARAVMFETSATTVGISHRLLVARAQESFVLAAMRAALPGVNAAAAEAHQMRPPVRAVELALSDHNRVLSVTQAERASAAILSSLQPLRSDEEIVIQWTASPVGPPQLVNVAPQRSGKQNLAGLLWDGLHGYQPAERAKALASKQSGPLFVAVGRVGVVASDSHRARGLLARVLGTFHVVNGPGVRLRRRFVPGQWAARNLRDRRLPIVAFPAVLNAAELATLVAFPTGNLSLPGLSLGGCRSLAPSADIPATGRVLGQARFPGAERPIALSNSESLRHLHVIGPTGVGKSTLLLGLITQDMSAGHGVVVIEPAGDLVRDVLDRVPAERIRDVVVLDPADADYPVGLNVLATGETDRELVAEQIVGIFSQIFRANWGPRSDDILRSALLTLATQPGMTLCDVPLILTDSAFRRRLVARLDDPILQQFWGWYENVSESERAQVIAPVQNKLRSFLGRRRLRNVLGQANGRFDFDRALNARRIVLVPTNKGTLGEEAAALWGSLVVARLWQAVMRRASQTTQDRPTTFAFVDEFQDYVRLPQSIPDVLAQARKLKLGLTLAHQHLGQLPTPVADAVLANAKSRVIFQTGADDGRRLARELSPYVDGGDLQGLEAYEVVMSVSAGGRVAPPVTGMTSPAPPTTGHGEAARAWSREHYGRPRLEVESEIRARYERGPAVGPIGRREVSS